MKKSILQVDTKPDITSNLLHELILNGYLPQQTIQTTDIDDIEIKVLKVNGSTTTTKYPLTAHCSTLSES
ncbi:MAG: hypothetical protein ACTS73_02585 [Arsenophonus sp. NEOnobi-MAG3]